MNKLKQRLKHWIRWHVVADEYYHCPFCDGRLIWGSDFDAEEDDDFAYSTSYTCEDCKRDIFVYHPND